MALVAGAAPAARALEVLEERAPLAIGEVAAAGLEPLSAPRSLGFTGRPAWVRLRAENPGAVAVEQALSWEWPLVDRLEVWTRDARGGWEVRRGGLALARGKRDLTQAAQRHLRLYRLAPGQAMDAYVRVDTRGPMLLEGRFEAPRLVVRAGALGILWLGLWGGALMVLLATALLSWRARRDGVYVRYALFCLGVAAYQADMTGVLATASAWLSTSSVWLEPVLGAAAALAGVEFTRRYLATGRSVPRLDAGLRWLGGIAALAALPALAGRVVLANQLTSVTGGLAIGACLLVSLVVAARGDGAARNYLVGFLPFAVAGGWYVSTLRGVLPPSHLAEAAFQGTFLLTGLSVALGLSGQRRAEEAANRRFLEAAVADRTRALDATVARLGAAQRLEAVGRLTAGVAHDFNNLLTAIAAGANELRVRAPTGGEEAAVLQEIRDLVRRGGELTRSLLSMARRQPISPRPVALNALVEELVRLLDRIVKGVEVRLELGPEVGTVVADPGQLEQVVLNLVINARDACNGRGRIEVSTRRLQRAHGEGGRPGGAWIRLTVTDDGPGMDGATRARVFEPFFTTKGEGRGTGLGLSVVDGVAKAHGGFVEVVSEPGRGAAFSVWLPASGGPSPEVAPDLTPPPGGALTAPPRSVT